MTFFVWPLNSASHSVTSLVIPSSGITHNLIVPSSEAVAKSESLKGENSKSLIGPPCPFNKGKSASNL